MRLQESTQATKMVFSALVGWSRREEITSTHPRYARRLDDQQIALIPRSRHAESQTQLEFVGESER